MFSVYVKVIATLWQLWILKKGKFLNMFSVTIGKFLNRIVVQWIDKYIYLECEPPGLKSLLTTSLGVACSISANVYSENFKQQDSCT